MFFENGRSGQLHASAEISPPWTGVVPVPAASWLLGGALTLLAPTTRRGGLGSSRAAPD